MSERPGFWLYKWSDETSQYDPNGRWQGGSECYMVDYEMWIPDSIVPENEEAINSYIDAEWDRQSEVQALRDEVARLRQALQDIHDSIGNGALNVEWIKRFAQAALDGGKGVQG